MNRLSLAAIFFTLSSLYINAATSTVTNTNDSGAGSLRQAIADAAPSDTINFSASISGGTITLTSGRLLIDKNLTIEGPGAILLSISGNGTSNVFYINNSGVTAALDGMTITGGNNDNGGGGGILNGGTLRVSNCIVSGNHADDVIGYGDANGGGISNHGTLTVNNSMISDNQAYIAGGIANVYGGTLTISNSTVSDNTSGTIGGGIVNGSGGMMTVNNSTISGNISSSDGSGIYSNYNGTLTVVNSSVTGNSAFESGGGIYSNGGTEALKNSIVAGNTLLPNVAWDISGAIETASHNLIGDAGSSGGIENDVNGNIVGVNPLLGPLEDNGGQTMTHALLPGSPAINAGDNCVLTENGCGFTHPALTADQRGMPRNGAVDIGAFERQANNTSGKPGPYDFDGDGKTDVSIFRPDSGQWWVAKSSDGGSVALTFGSPTDIPTPGDFTGDGKADIAFYRPSTGEWFILRSEDNSYLSFPFGVAGDIPAPADFDGDGRTDAAVFRPSSGVWFVLPSTGAPVIALRFGVDGDQPVPADYDGDGKADIAIIRRTATNMQWWIQGSSGGLFATTFGANTDKAIPGDYTGDGKADIAVWRPSDGNWFVLKSEDFSYFAFPFGQTGDIPVPGDYDGDHKFDAAVFRPSTSTWFANLSGGSGYLISSFGVPTDTPVPSVYVR